MVPRTSKGARSRTATVGDMATVITKPPQVLTCFKSSGSEVDGVPHYNGCIQVRHEKLRSAFVERIAHLHFCTSLTPLLLIEEEGPKQAGLDTKTTRAGRNAVGTSAIPSCSHRRWRQDSTPKYYINLNTQFGYAGNVEITHTHCHSSPGLLHPTLSSLNLIVKFIWIQL
jgi:hypothetical protein